MSCMRVDENCKFSLSYCFSLYENYKSYARVLVKVYKQDPMYGRLRKKALSMKTLRKVEAK